LPNGDLLLGTGVCVAGGEAAVDLIARDTRRQALGLGGVVVPAAPEAIRIEATGSDAVHAGRLR